ncbi:glycoside hydrolase family 114 protein [Ephemerocybe angulata]|uniref:alpha-galactosidase n=1 Tax=Ephemerocybe angulata TaxID=980116 RepID=A0A8H6H9L7_9AGAR|nr:glycoside hydrolase family 114 protein [Tulosesus angulatus]
MLSTFALALCSIAMAQASTLPNKRSLVLPPENGQFDYQLGGEYTPPPGTQIVVRDRTASPAPNVYNICYINAFQTQPDETAWWKANHHTLLLRNADNKYFEDSEWPGEVFFDTRTNETRTAIAGVLNGWIDGCAAAGFKAIDPDNLDTYTRSKGLLTKTDNLALAKLIADHAHTLDITIGQKNCAELGAEGKMTVGFDFAVAEECQAYEECGAYTDVYGASVLEIEYTDSKDSQKVFQDACKSRSSVILRDRKLAALGKSGYHYETCVEAGHPNSGSTIFPGKGTMGGTVLLSALLSILSPLAY